MKATETNLETMETVSEEVLSDEGYDATVETGCGISPEVKIGLIAGGVSAGVILAKDFVVETVVPWAKGVGAKIKQKAAEAKQAAEEKKAQKAAEKAEKEQKQN